MAEQRLHKIIDAADRDDGEDVAIRKLLVTALRDSGLEITQLVEDRSPLLLKSCGRDVGRRATPHLPRQIPRNRRKISRRNRRR